MNSLLSSGPPVASQGFHPDDVRDVVRRLAAAGRTVDLNAVLDRLMSEAGTGGAPSPCGGGRCCGGGGGGGGGEGLPLWARG